MAKSTAPAPTEGGPEDYRPPSAMDPEQRAMHVLENYKQYNQKCQSLGETFEELAKQVAEQVPAGGARIEVLRKLVQAREMAFGALG